VAGNQAEISMISAENTLEIFNFRLVAKLLFGVLLQRGIATLDCEAAALPGRFLPELGRSSERPFFLAGSFAS